MDWTDLISEPRGVTAVYGGAPSLRGFALEDLILTGGGARIRGDLGTLPDPLPERWAERGYTRARATFDVVEIEEAEVTGTPRLHVDSRRCLEGDPVDLSVESVGRSWALPNGEERPYVVLWGRSAFLSFRLVCRHLSVDVSGYTPAPY